MTLTYSTRIVYTTAVYVVRVRVQKDDYDTIHVEKTAVKHSQDAMELVHNKYGYEVAGVTLARVGTALTPPIFTETTDAD